MEPNKILSDHFGHDNFRPLQEDIINAVLNGHDTLALMPTGGGKSVCFQVPALTREGICIVISPLIALMKDQVSNLLKKEINAVAVFSGMSYREIDITLDNCIYGKVKFLYLSPERLATDIFRERLKKMQVNLIAVDEAHCISQWGHDFRPTYLKIAEIRELLPGIPILALTATATHKVKADIQDKLLFENGKVFQKSFIRKNLSYVALKEEDKLERILKILKKVPGSGIIYVRNRRRTKEIADFLLKNKIKADHYHAGLQTDVRTKRQDEWMSDKTRIIVCTNAFGMGIDKPDVYSVIHLDLPDSIEEYFQEAGRAGRDEKKAYAVFLYNNADLSEADTRLEVKFPDIKLITQVYQSLANHYQLAIGAGEGESFDLDINDFSVKFDINPLIAYNAIKLLEKDGWITLTEKFSLPSRIMFLMNDEELYKFEVSNEKYGVIIKLLLRSYGGLFDNYVNISEKVLAKRSEKNNDKIVEELFALKQLKVLDYEPQKNKPQITYIRSRADIRYLKIDKRYLKERKDNYTRKLQAVIDYASNKIKCRSQMLLAYFGEDNSEKCGVCDVCMENYRLKAGDMEFENILNLVKSKLSENEYSLDELSQLIEDVKEEKILKAIQWLMDIKQVALNENNKLTWVG